MGRSTLEKCRGLVTDPTPRQREIALFLLCYHARQGRSPTVREIMREFGMASPHGPVEHLQSLVRKGWLQQETFSARGFCLTRKALEELQHPLVWLEEGRVLLTPAPAEGWTLTAARELGRTLLAITGG